MTLAEFIEGKQHTKITDIGDTLATWDAKPTNMEHLKVFMINRPEEDSHAKDLRFDLDVTYPSDIIIIDPTGLTNQQYLEVLCQVKASRWLWCIIKNNPEVTDNRLAHDLANVRQRPFDCWWTEPALGLEDDWLVFDGSRKPVGSHASPYVHCGHRKVIVTVETGELWYRRYTLPRLEAYAARIGADFMVWRQPFNHVMYDSYASWAKMDLIAWFAKQDLYQAFCHVDADMIVSNDAANIFDVLEPGSIAIVGENCQDKEGRWMHCIDESKRAWMAKHMGVEKSEGDRYYNAGFFAMDVECAQSFDTSGPYPREPWWDQDWLNARMTGLNIQELGNEWNKHEYWQPDWRTGHFVHPIGPEAKQRIKEVAEMFEAQPDPIRESDKITHKSDLPSLANALGYQNMIEIGVGRGMNLLRWVNEFRGAVHGVDLWRKYEGYTDHPDAQGYLRGDQEFVERTFAGKAEVKCSSSQTAVKLFADVQFQFVYIDANPVGHHHQNDLRIWWERLEVGGILAGGAYIDKALLGDCQNDVKRHVDKFASDHNCEVFLTQDDIPSWWMVKRDEPHNPFWT